MMRSEIPMVPPEFFIKLGLALSATPITFGLLQATNIPSLDNQSWKPILDTGIVGAVCIASFWLIRYLLNQLVEQAKMHKEDYRSLVIDLNNTMKQTLELRGREEKILEGLVDAKLCEYPKQQTLPQQFPPHR